MLSKLYSKKKKTIMGKKYTRKGSAPVFDLEDIEEGLEGYEELEKSSLMSQKNFEKRFGQSPVFIASTLKEDGGVPEGTNSTALIKEAIHVISCGYEEKTEWGKEVSIRQLCNLINYYKMLYYIIYIILQLCFADWMDLWLSNRRYINRL